MSWICLPNDRHNFQDCTEVILMRDLPTYLTSTSQIIKKAIRDRHYILRTKCLQDNNLLYCVEWKMAKLPDAL